MGISKSAILIDYQHGVTVYQWGAANAIRNGDSLPNSHPINKEPVHYREFMCQSLLIKDADADVTIENLCASHSADVASVNNPFELAIAITPKLHHNNQSN